MSIGTAGSLIMDTASLFFMTGILNYTELYRKRGRLDDRLYFSMVIVNIIMTLADALAYFLERRQMSLVRETIMASNVVFFASFAYFGYLLMMYLDYRVYRDKGRLRKLRIPAFIPFLLLFVLLLINLKTGWLYTIADDATYQIGPLNNLIFVPAAIYFAAAEMLLFKINFRLGALGALIIISRIFWGFISRDISSTSLTYTLFLVSLTYTLFLVCIHLHAMNAPMMEEMTREKETVEETI